MTNNSRREAARALVQSLERDGYTILDAGPALRAADAVLDAADAQGWRPISEAPKEPEKEGENND